MSQGGVDKGARRPKGWGLCSSAAHSFLVLEPTTHSTSDSRSLSLRIRTHSKGDSLACVRNAIFVTSIRQHLLPRLQNFNFKPLR